MPVCMGGQKKIELFSGLLEAEIVFSFFEMTKKWRKVHNIFFKFCLWVLGFCGLRVSWCRYVWGVRKKLNFFSGLLEAEIVFSFSDMTKKWRKVHNFFLNFVCGF